MRADHHQGEIIDVQQFSKRYLYIYVFCCGSTLLYRIDAVDYLQKLSSSFHKLLPHAHFSREAIPPFAVSVKLGSVFYFIGGDIYGNKKAKATDVYVITESEISNLTFDERNPTLSLRKTTSMNSAKKKPVAFVADGQLYVLSGSGTEFEVFSPTQNSWKNLSPKPSSHTVLSFLVVKNKVYFATNSVKQKPPVLCYDLVGDKWTLLSSKSSGNFQKFPQQTYPTFYSCVQIVGSMAIGYIRNDKRTSGSLLTISASSLSNQADFLSDGFMLPSFAPDNNFLAKLRSEAYQNMVEEEDLANTEHLLTIDKKTLCVISYGSACVAKEDIQKYKWRTSDPFKSYLTLTFFEVDDAEASPKCFKAESLRSVRFIINTNDLITDGEIVTCIY